MAVTTSAESVNGCVNDATAARPQAAITAAITAGRGLTDPAHRSANTPTRRTTNSARAEWRAPRQYPALKGPSTTGLLPPSTTMSETRQTDGSQPCQPCGVMEDFERCYGALKSRDPRFDGWFFTAVTSTRIYCRPSCPATTPKRRSPVLPDGGSCPTGRVPGVPSLQAGRRSWLARMARQSRCRCARRQAHPARDRGHRRCVGLGRAPRLRREAAAPCSDGRGRDRSAGAGSSAARADRTPSSGDHRTPGHTCGVRGRLCECAPVQRDG